MRPTPPRCCPSSPSPGDRALQPTAPGGLGVTPAPPQGASTPAVHWEPWEGPWEVSTGWSRWSSEDEQPTAQGNGPGWGGLARGGGL